MVTITDEEAVTKMIESREWWVLVDADDTPSELPDLIQSRFFPEANGDFRTIVGPAPGPFAEYFHRQIMVLHFAKKSKLTAANLEDLINSHPDHVGHPAKTVDGDKDVLFLLKTP